jgi:hypothetical protein
MPVMKPAPRDISTTRSLVSHWQWPVSFLLVLHTHTHTQHHFSFLFATLLPPWQCHSSGRPSFPSLLFRLPVSFSDIPSYVSFSIYLSPFLQFCRSFLSLCRHLSFAVFFIRGSQNLVWSFKFFLSKSFILNRLLNFQILKACQVAELLQFRFS